MKVQWFLIYSLHQHMHSLPHYQPWRTVHFYQGWVCVDASNHPCPLFTLGCIWWLAFCGLGKHTVAYTHYFNNIECVHCPKNSLFFLFIISLCSLIPANHWSFYWIHNLAFSKMLYSWNHIVCKVFFQNDFFHLDVCV